MIVRIRPSGKEWNACSFSRDTIEKTSRCMRHDGALILQNIISTSLVKEARQAFMQRYAHYLNAQEHDDALEVGDKRIMITLDIEPPFDRPELFANHWLLPILRAAFEDEFVLGGYGVVCSLPGAQSQHRHRDGGILFPQSGLDRLLPAAAITVGIPLLEMNEIHGTTELWLGSHRDSDHIVTPTAPEKGNAPVVRKGSCVLWDYRLVHSGTPNRGTEPRPLLYLTYCRPWFLDYLNYAKQPLLRASRRYVSALSDENRRLLARATAHWLPELRYRTEHGGLQEPH